MSYGQETQLVEEIHRVINRFRLEYDLNYAATLGCIELVKMDIWKESQELEDEE